MEGLSAQMAGVTNTYGNGEGQNTKHSYGGTIDKKEKKVACKKKKKPMSK
jgi:hypothetical protein